MTVNETHGAGHVPEQSAFSLLLGIEITTCTREEVICHMLVTKEMANRNGVLHGGAMMTLADNTAGTAAFVNCPAGFTNTTIEAKTNFIRMVKVGDTVTARCEPFHVGRTTLVLQVTLTRGDGKVVATTTQTHMFLAWKEHDDK